MTDLELAIKNLEGHTLALCRDGDVIVSDERGVAPMVGFLREGRQLSGYSAADRVIGKAAAMLFVKASVREVYAYTMSTSAVAVLTAHGVPFSYGKLTDRVMNRDNTGLCPMESTVSVTDDVDTGVEMIFRKLDELRAGRK